MTKLSKLKHQQLKATSKKFTSSITNYNVAHIINNNNHLQRGSA